MPFVREPRLTEMSAFLLQRTVVLRLPGYAALQGLCAHVEAEGCGHCLGCVWRHRSNLYYRPNSSRKRDHFTLSSFVSHVPPTAHVTAKRRSFTDRQLPYSRLLAEFFGHLPNALL